MNPTIEKENKYCAQNYSPLPVVLTKGVGVYVWDDTGKKYLDFMSAYSAVSAGHSHPRLIAALEKQAKELTIVSRAFYTDKLAPFLEKLCSITGLPKALPMNTGAEAVETAIKAARRWGYDVKGIAADKAEIIVSQGNFHGRTTTIVGFSSSAGARRGYGPFDGGFKAVPFGDIEALEGAITENTCAFITEPMQGEGGIIIPPKGWLKKVRALCTKHNVLLILDEVQTGLGRTGRDFAFQHEIGDTAETMPDGLILGKALGGGLFPVSAFMASDAVMGVFDAGSHGSTWGGNPLAAAIGLEALCLFEEENFSERSAELGQYLMAQIKDLQMPCIKEVRGSGLWVGVEFYPKHVDAHDVCLALLDKGVLAKETHQTVIRFAPPLIVSKQEIDVAVQALKEALTEIVG